jgi:hypothetical protein
MGRMTLPKVPPKWLPLWVEEVMYGFILDLCAICFHRAGAPQPATTI